MTHGGNFLKELIKKRGITAKSVYTSMDISTNGFVRWTTGHNIISCKYLPKLKQALNMSPIEYATLVSAVQTDVLESWRNKE